MDESEFDDLRPEDPPKVLVMVGPRSGTFDERLAPMVHQAWLADIAVTFSYVRSIRGVAMARVGFIELEDLERFLELVVRRESGADALYARIFNGFNAGLNGENSATAWHADVELSDSAAALRVCGAALPNKSVSLHIDLVLLFPVTEIPLLVDLLRDFNESEGRF